MAASFKPPRSSLQKAGGPVCAVCKSTDIRQDDDDNWFCASCSAQVQDITLREVNDGDGLGTQHGHTRSQNRRRSSADHRKRRRSEAAERAQRRRYSDAQLLEAFQRVLKAQVVALVERFGCSSALHERVRSLWWAYITLRADPAHDEDLPAVKLPLTACFCALGCFLGREPLLSADLHRAMLAGSVPYLNSGGCLPPTLSGLGLQDFGGPLCARDTSAEWEEEVVRPAGSGAEGEISGAETSGAETSGAEGPAGGGDRGSQSSGVDSDGGGWKGTGRNAKRGAGRGRHHQVPLLKFFRLLTKRLANHLPAARPAYILHCPMASAARVQTVEHPESSRPSNRLANQADKENLAVPVGNPPLVALRYITSWGLPADLFGYYDVTTPGNLYVLKSINFPLFLGLFSDVCVRWSRYCWGSIGRSLRSTGLQWG